MDRQADHGADPPAAVTLRPVVAAEAAVVVYSVVGRRDIVARPEARQVDLLAAPGEDRPEDRLVASQLTTSRAAAVAGRPAAAVEVVLDHYVV